jgi:hypothetical protein
MKKVRERVVGILWLLWIGGEEGVVWYLRAFIIHTHLQPLVNLPLIISISFLGERERERCPARPVIHD